MADSCLTHVYHSKQLEALTEKMEKAEGRLGVLEMSWGEVSTKVSGYSDTQERLIDALEVLKEKPGKRWEQVITTTIGVIVTACIMFLINKLG